MLLLATSALSETRPRYGGTLKVETHAAPQSLDPAVPNQDPGFAQIAPLLFDTLIQLDATGRALPSSSLAACQPESERRWRCSLRSGVRFSDGTPLTPAVAAQSLQEANADWNLRVVGDVVVIESEQPLPSLPAVLALSRNAIVLRADGKLLGTGPFRAGEFQPGRRLVLAAVEDGWHERPFVDAIEIQFNRGAREQGMDFELNRADVIEVPNDQVARLTQSGRRVFTSDPVDLLALRFSHSNLRDARVREAIALTVDRESIFSVLLQRRGEATAALLPNWMTGYSFLFATGPQVARARQLRAEARQSAPLTLMYDAADPLARLVAERVAVNANDAGIALRTVPSTQNVAVPDVELVRVRVASSDPATALVELARTDRLALSLPETPAPSSPSPGADKGGAPAVDVYRTSVATLQEHWAVPIAYSPAAYAVSGRVHNWSRTRDGSWRLESVWLEAR